MRDAFAAHDDGGPGPIDRLDETAKTLHEATTAATPAPAPGVARVAVVSKRPDVRGYLAGLAHGAIRTGIQFFAIALLTFLLLATGDRYKKKTIALAGRTFVNRKITLELMASIDRQIERYLVVRVLISAIVATATGIALGLLSVNHAAAWGIVAGVLNVFPFIGPTAGVALITVAAFVQFRTLEMTAAAGGSALAVAAIEGNLLTPLLMSRAGELNTVAVFVSVLVWGWVWDAWGLLLAVPIMVAVKAAADHIESLKPLGELLRRESD